MALQRALQSKMTQRTTKSFFCVNFVIKTSALFREPLWRLFPLQLLIGHTPTLPTPHYCHCFPKHNVAWQDETVPSGIFTMKPSQIKSQVYGYTH